MASPLRTFVSFSSHDMSLVRRLFERLRAQPLELWDYSSEGEEIPGSEKVIPYLLDRVNGCQLFIPVVSPRSLESTYTRAEVARALDRNETGSLRIIPLVAASCSTDHSQWPEPYRRLGDIRYYSIDGASRDSIEEAVRRLCLDLGLCYSPPYSGDPRLTFLQRFDDEIEDARTRRQERDISIFSRLTRVRNEVVRAVNEGEYELARTRMNFFTATLEYEFDGQEFYYPYIVKAVCEISCGLLTLAMETLRPLTTSSLVDANVFGAIGYIRNQQELYAEALAYYEEAVRHDPTDSDAKHGVLLNAIMADRLGAVDVAATMADLDRVQTLMPEDRTKRKELKAYALTSLGAREEALSVYEELQSSGEATPDTAINYARLLALMRGRPAALDFLQSHLPAYGTNPNYLHYLASACLGEGRVDEARQHARRLVALAPENRQYRLDLAQVLWRTGQRVSARRSAERALDLQSFPLPTGAQDFYVCGFANFILGRRERAEYDFERSGYPEKRYYIHILPDPPGATSRS